MNRSWTLDEDALLGTAQDAELKKLLGRSIQSIKERRARFGIPVFKHQCTQNSVHVKVIAAWRFYEALPVAPSSYSAGYIVSWDLIKAMQARKSLAAGRYLALRQMAGGVSSGPDHDDDDGWPLDPYDDPAAFGSLLAMDNIVEFLQNIASPGAHAGGA